MTRPSHPELLLRPAGPLLSFNFSPRAFSTLLKEERLRTTSLLISVNVNDDCTHRPQPPSTFFLPENFKANPNTVSFYPQRASNRKG